MGLVGEAGQSNPHWSPNYFIFMMTFVKMLAKWSNRTFANSNSLSKNPGSAPDSPSKSPGKCLYILFDFTAAGVKCRVSAV